MITRTWLYFSLLAALAPLLMSPSRALAQTPTNCPSTVNPGWIGYPGNVMDYSDGLRSGR